MNKKELIAFEVSLAQMFEEKKIHVPLHLSGGNEEQLIEIFKEIREDDYVFSTHRNHYHYLLHGGSSDALVDEILGQERGLCRGRSGSMHTIDTHRNFFSSGIVSGCVAIAVGVALSLRSKGSSRHVWCFVGDGASDSGYFIEAVRYAICNTLPVTYIVEDNDRSVCTTIKQRWGWEITMSNNEETRKYIRHYRYTPTYPHCGCGTWVTFDGGE